MQNAVVVGLDLGHSAVKITFDGRAGVERHIFPSFAFQAISIRNDAEAKLAAAETVQVNGKDFFVGETAALHGKAGLSTGLTPEWIRTPEHCALLAMAAKIIDEKTPKGERFYVLGLPVSQYESQRKILAEVAKDHLGSYAQIRILPQPIGGYQAHMMGRSGAPRVTRSLPTESWAVVDVGYYSTDFVLIKEGRWVEPACGSCGGMRMAAEHLQRLISDHYGVSLDLFDTEEALRRRNIKYLGRPIDLEKEIQLSADAVASKVLDMATQLMDPYVKLLDGVLVIGGGAEQIFPHIHAQWPHAQLVEDAHPVPEVSGSRFIVSEGYYRFGRSISLINSMGSKAA